MSTRFVALGALLGGLGVGLGAFGAHGLKERLSADMMEIYQTGVLYHLVHALALVLVGLLGLQRKRPLRLAGWSFALGVLVFSGSLYVLAISGQTWLGAVTPFGGTAFLVGWGALAWSCRKPTGG